MYTTTVLNRARAKLLRQNEENEANYQAHLARAYAQLPRLREIDRSLRGTLAKLTEATFRNNGDPSAEISRLREENLRLQSERRQLVTEYLPAGYLDDSPSCPHCGGSGYVGSRMCECLQRLCCQEQQRELTALLPTGRESFENFSLELYPERFCPEYGTSARTLMQKNLSFCRKYAQEFRPGAASLLFSGATGLGKTFLSACVARAAAERGFSVCYDTASSVIGSFEAQKFARDESADARVKRMLSCDLMILDDLGTEMPTPMAESALYTLINTRLVEGRKTIISTNLSFEEMGKRYSGQICSRIRGEYRLLPFVGRDIRLLRR